MTGAASASAGARAATSWSKCPPPLGGARGRLPRLLRARLTALWLARRSQGRDRPTGRPATASGVAASKVADFPAFGHVGGDIMHADGTVLHTVGAGAATARAAEAAPSAPSGSSV